MHQCQNDHQLIEQGVNRMKTTLTTGMTLAAIVFGVLVLLWESLRPGAGRSEAV